MKNAFVNSNTNHLAHSVFSQNPRNYKCIYYNSKKCCGYRKALIFLKLTWKICCKTVYNIHRSVFGTLPNIYDGNSYCFVRKVPFFRLRVLTGKKHLKIKLQRLWKIQILTFGSLVHQINSLQEVLNLEQIFQKN